jgi:hypothetical protein
MNAACEHSYLMDEETCFRVIKEIILSRFIKICVCIGHFSVEILGNVLS